MADLKTLVARVLEEVGIDGSSETPTKNDEDKVLTGLKSAHYILKTEGLLRWTMSDIPPELEEPYVLLGAYNCGTAFGMPQEPTKSALAMKQIRAHVMTIASGCAVPSENF